MGPREALELQPRARSLLNTSHRNCRSLMTTYIAYGADASFEAKERQGISMVKTRYCS